jgi:hypothetical protein
MTTARSQRLATALLASSLLAPLADAPGQEVAQSPKPCSNEAYRAFDFWIGHWRVTEDGKLAGENRIEPILGGCALSESWRGAGASRGRSLNFYDTATNSWHQTWIDNSGGALYLTGGLEDGRMVLSGERPPRPASESNAPTLHRITWTPLPEGRVRQHWEASQDGGATWRTLFDGLYQRESGND